MKIEDAILSNDKMGISKVRKYLPENFCEKAAEYILEHSKRILIATGFYVNEKCDIDGLPGAIFLSQVLKSLGSEITFVTDKYCSNILKQVQDFSVIDFPLNEIEDNFSEALIQKLNPALIISIERCGAGKDGNYYNFKGENITEHTAKLDFLMERISYSVAVGDLGNEMGMGDLYGWTKKEKIVPEPSVTKAKHLVISSISNWGCYGIIAYISKFLKKDYLKIINEEELLKKLNKLGAIDGITHSKEQTVDGHTLEETKEILKKLHFQI